MEGMTFRRKIVLKATIGNIIRFTSPYLIPRGTYTASIAWRAI